MSSPQRINPDTLPPTQLLLCELLAARHRTGAAWWPIPNRLRKTLAELGDLGLVTARTSGPPGSQDAQLTELGRELFMPQDWNPPAPGDLAALLRYAAQGRREYARSSSAAPEDQRLLEMQAATLEGAAQVAEGQTGPLYNWIPTWRQTPNMVAALHGKTIPVADMRPPERRCRCVCVMEHPKETGVCVKQAWWVVVSTNRPVARTPMCSQCTELAAGKPGFVRVEPLEDEESST